MKKLILFLTIFSALFCLLMMSASAATPELYIEFQVEMAGSTEKTTVYVENPEEGNPRINLTFDFYYDLDFTQVVDKSQITVLDFSNAVHSNPSKDYVDRFTTADPSTYPLCEEIRWFSRKFTSAPSNIFKDWTQLKRFDFGCLTMIDYGFLSNTGLVEVVIPAAITNFNNGVFGNCKNLTSVKFEGGLTKIGTGVFQNCTALTSVDLGTTSVTNTSMFQGCTSLVSITMPYITKIAESVFRDCSALTTVDLSSATDLKEIGKYAFANCTSLKTIISSGVNQEGAAIIPEGVTWIGQEAFYNCDSIKYLSLPSTVTYLGPSIIRDSSGLQFVDFNDNQNAINLDNWGHFSGCSSLKAASLPDGIVTINNRFMTSCTSMQAVYLPANLEQMNTNGNGQGPFCFSAKMYFVQESFEVRDENGYFLGDSFVMPVKPEVYYMPSKLARAGGNASSGTWFRECASLNNTIIMPETFTESTVAQMFRGIASSSQQKNVVYLGAMTNYCWSEMNKYINFVFANPANTDLSTITFTAFYNRNNENCYFYFCHTGLRYTMAKSSADEVAATKVENTYCHIAEMDMETPATCEMPKMVASYCFCGQYIPGTETTEGTPLGHNYTGAVSYMFTTVYENGEKCTACLNNCGKDLVEVLAPVYTELGYSASTFDNKYSITNGYKIDRQSLALYEEAKGVTVKLGFAFNAANSFTDGEVTLDSFKLKAEVNNQYNGIAFDYHDFIISYSDDTHLNDNIIVGAYVVEKGQDSETVYFINRSYEDGVNGFEAVSYNSIIG